MLSTAPNSPGLAPQRPAVARRAQGLVSSAIRDLLQHAERPDVLSLAGGLPDGSSFPIARIALAAERALSQTGRYGAVGLQYGPTEGLTTLREWAAETSLVHDGFGDVDEVLVTTGSQQGLDLVARTLVDPGDVVMVEDPLYLGARQVLVAAGAQLIAVPVDQDGVDVEFVERSLVAGARPRLIYAVPHFQNPTGSTMSAERRRRLAELALRFGVVIVEDDPYVALSFDGSRGPSLGSLAPEHTVTLASGSKVLAPGLRVGWLRAPGWLHRSLVLAKQSCDLHTSGLDQLIALDVLSDERFVADHVRALRETYRARAFALHDALDGLFATSRPSGGMFLWGTADRDTQAVFRAAISAGVAYVPGAAFAVEASGERTLRLSFATLNEAELVDAASRLRSVFA